MDFWGILRDNNIETIISKPLLENLGGGERLQKNIFWAINKREIIWDSNKIVKCEKFFEYFRKNRETVLEKYKYNKYLGNAGNILRTYSKNYRWFRKEFWRN